MKLPFKTLFMSLLLLAAVHSAATAQVIYGSGNKVPDMAEYSRILKSRTTIEIMADGHIKATVKYADGSAVEGKPIVFFVFKDNKMVKGFAVSSDEQGAGVFERQPDSLNNCTVKISLRFLGSVNLDHLEKELGEVVFDEQGKVAEIRYAATKEEKSGKKKRSKK